MSFIHLQIATAYSLLSSTISIEKLVQKAREMNYQALAITDRNVLYGAIPFYKECKAHGIKPIIGLTADVKSEIEPGMSYPIVLLAKSYKGYQNLVKISSTIQTKAPEGIPLKWLKGYREDLYAFTPGMAGEIEQFLLNNEVEKAENAAKKYQLLFEKDAFFISLQRHKINQEETIFPKLIHISKKLGIKTIVSNNVQYLEQEDAFSHECLLAIKEGAKLSEEERPRLQSEEYYLKPSEEMAKLFSEEIEALETTWMVSETCRVDIPFQQKLLPKFPLEDGTAACDLLRTSCEDGVRKRIANPGTHYWERLDYELEVINKMGFNDYFLIVWDFMEFSRSRGILTGPGRGSAAGSLVAYALGITDVDPIEYDLLFERFLNPERVSMPDIDIDFPDNRREEVIQYVSNKYGALHVSQIITFGTFAAKAAVRDVARIFGFNTKELEYLSRLVSSRNGLRNTFNESEKLRSFVEESELNAKLFDTALRIEGLPRHASTHAAGVVMSEFPLVNIIPIQEGHEGVYLTQYPMEVLEEIGLLKMDFLGLRNLTILERIVTNIQKGTKKRLDIKQIPLDDKETYQLLSRGFTTGIFQLESEGMRNVLLRLRPTHFEDIVAVNALYRPGPMENIPMYIERKHGQADISYPHPDLKPILEKTNGVIVYQEQIMQIASRMAGFSLGEADLLRRAVSKKKKEVLDYERTHFVKGTLKKGYDEKTANEIYDLIVRFANYGFNRSHAVAYSLIAYQLAYLKAHYPLYFMAALLTSVVGNEDKIAQYLREANQLQIEILPPSINHSIFPFSVEKGAIRYSLAGIKGIGASVLKQILTARQSKPFKDLFDFCLRAPEINRKTLESLVLSGALDEFGMDRAVLLANIDVALEHAELMRPSDQGPDLFSNEELFHLEPKYIEVEPMEMSDKLALEKQVLGLYLSDHPVSPYEKMLERAGATPVFQLKAGQRNAIVGAYLTEVKTIRTKKGEIMVFLTASDSTGDVEGVIFPAVYRLHSNLCHQGSVILLKGHVEDRNGRLQFIVQKLEEAERIKEFESPKERLYIKVPKNHQDNGLLKEINAIFKKYKGNTPVILYYEQRNQTLQLSDKDWIQPASACLSELKALLGDSNVILK